MDRMVDEGQRDLVSALEHEVRQLRDRIDTTRKAVAALLLLLAIVLMWATDLGLESTRKAHFAAYEIAARCVTECDCSRIGPEPDR